MPQSTNPCGSMTRFILDETTFYINFNGLWSIAVYKIVLPSKFVQESFCMYDITSSYVWTFTEYNQYQRTSVIRSRSLYQFS